VNVGSTNEHQSWRVTGNLRGVTLANGTEITYLIDGRNRRVGKKINGVLVESFLYKDSLRHVGWYDGSGALKAQFIYGAHHKPDYMIKGSITYRFITDQVGSVRLVVDTTGNIAERLDFDEFGNVLADTAPGTSRIGFAGGMQDPDTGLTHFGARDYAPEVGRWTSRDPFLFAAGNDNLFAYVHSDPINRIDPSGRQGEDGGTFGGGGGDSGGAGAGRDVGGDSDGGFGGGGSGGGGISRCEDKQGKCPTAQPTPPKCEPPPRSPPYRTQGCQICCSAVAFAAYAACIRGNLGNCRELALEVYRECMSRG